MTEKPAQKNPASSRQNIRKWILIVSFLLIPVTIFYISPIILMMGAAEGIATGSMILLILLFVLSFFVARLWCGWLCPMGAWQEICSPIMKHTVQEGWRKYIKYGIAALWLGMLALSIVTVGGIRSVDPFYGTVNGISISSPDVLMVVAVIFAIIFVTAYLAGRRGFCSVLCPMAVVMIIGRKIGNLVNLPALRLTADPSRCIDCGKCSKACPMGLDVNGMVQKGEMETPECILCASCADTCPQGAIEYGTGRR
ncbi:MAG TPA: 4Fe-4S binding protein [Methanoregula sp.]|nr:4Fe-4S binding protein [Methanoregula sp.]